MKNLQDVLLVIPRFKMVARNFAREPKVVDLVFLTRVKINLSPSPMTVERLLARRHLHSVSGMGERARKSNILIAGGKHNLEDMKQVQKWRKQFGNLTIKMLNPETEVPQAQALLHDVFIEEQGWMFSEGNPTGFRIEHHGRRSILTDDLESHSSWFGSTFQGEVVACSRIVHRDNDGNLDITRYSDSEKPLTKHVLSRQVNPRLHEFQRIAINPLFRKTGAMCEIFNMAAHFILEEDSSLVGVTGNKSILRFIEKVGGMIIDENFDYGDGKPTKLIYWPNGLIKKIIANMESNNHLTARTTTDAIQRT